MGTTRTALTSDSGVELCFVLMIEGYDTLIASHPNTAAVITAYQATEWDTAISGLHVPDEYSERMELFSGKLDIPGMRFVVSPDSADTFGKLVHKTADPTGAEAFLTEDLDSETTLIPVDDITGFSDGDIFLGTECISFTGSSGTDLGTTTCFRGRYAPYKAESETEQRFGRPHSLPTIQGVNQRPKITDYPRIWVGKIVRCMVHRVHEVNGSVVIDTLANADTVFAGVIEAIGDSESGNTIIDCAHVNKIVNDTLLLRDQYVGTVKPGVYLSAGDGTTASTADLYSYTEASLTGSQDFTGQLTTVSGAPANAAEIQEGYYEYDELLDKLNEWLAYEFATNSANFLTKFDRRTIESGNVRTKMSAAGTVGIADRFDVGFSNNGKINLFLGWPSDEQFFAQTLVGTTLSCETTSPNTPLRSVAFQAPGTSDEEDQDKLPYSRIDIVNPTGTWALVPTVDVPDGFEASTGDWGFLKVGDVILQGKYDSDNERFTDLRIPDESVSSFLGLSNKAKKKEDLELYGQTDITSTSDVQVKQVVILQNELLLLLAKIFYGTGTAAYNNADYDNLPTQLTLGLPSELLGDGLRTDGSFLQALSDLQSVTESGDMTIMLDKPTRFGEILAPELVLRGASLRVKDGVLDVGIASTPGTTPEHSLTASNKAGDAAADDPQRTRSNRTARLIRDKITVKYNRSLDDKYRSDATVVNLTAVTDHGGYSNPITIKARNTVGGDQGTKAVIDAQLTELASYALGMFAHEVTEVSRTISRKHFHMLPGDTVALTDDSVRNPLTGTRGVTAYPCWAESVTRNWATGIGEVKLIMLGLLDPSRYGIYSPTAEMSAYNTGTGVATVLENAYSLPDDADDVTHFGAGDVVRFIEVSPADPSAPSTWTDTIDSISGNDITTVNNNGSGTYSSSLTYVIVSDDRANAAATQQTDAYYADDADNRVQNDVNSYLWTREPFTVNLSYGINSGSLHLTDASSQFIYRTDALATGFESITAFTSAQWIYFDSFPNNENWFICKWNASTSQRSFSTEYNNGSNILRCIIKSTAVGERPSSVSWTPELCRWYHVAFTFDGAAGEVKFYVDGNQQGATQATTATDVVDSTTTVRWGSVQNNSAYFDGDVDNIEWWTRALTAAEIKANMYTERLGNETDLVCFLPLNTNYSDRTATANNFTASGGASITSATPWSMAPSPYRYPSNLADAEGEPVSVFHHSNAALALNNLISYKTAPQAPWAVGDTESSAWDYRYTSADSDVWRLVTVFPFAVHQGTLAASDRYTRKLVVSPQFYRVSGSAAVSCRITLTQAMPTGGDWDDVIFREPYRQLEFSTSSTSPIIVCPQTEEPPDWLGVTWVAVELKADNTETAAFCGLPILYLGPLSS